jgi:hypothetical protein
MMDTSRCLSSRLAIGHQPRIDHHLASAPKSDWAWEFLRRNAEYQGAAAETQHQMVKVGTVGSAIPVFALHKQEEAAQDWALCSFREPNRQRWRRIDLLERR